MDSMADTNSKFSFRSIKWGLLTGLVVCSGLAYRSYGYRLTAGNLFGIKIESMTISDPDTGKVYDNQGKLVRVEKVEKGQYPFEYRKLKLEIPRARGIRISFDGRQYSSRNSSEGSFEVPYAIQDSQQTVSYRIDATADDWQILETWNCKRPSKVFRLIKPYHHDFLETTLPEVNQGDPPTDEYVVRIYKKNEPNPLETTIVSVNKIISDSLRGKPEDIVKIELGRRNYRELAKGYLAFGKKPDPRDQITPNLPPLVSCIDEPSERFGEGTQWSYDGKKQPYRRSIATETGQGNIELEKRLIHIRILAPTTNRLSSVNIHRENGITFLSVNRSGVSFQDREEWLATALVPKSLKKTDLKVQVTNSPFKEVLRTDEPKPLKMGTEPIGTAIIEKLEPNNSVRETYWNYSLKPPAKYKEDSLRLTYIDSTGQEQLALSSFFVPSTGHVGMQFVDELHPNGGIKGLILQARPWQTYTIKDVPLYPRDTKL